MVDKADQIVEEIRQYRKAHAASLNFDLKRITQDLQRQEQQSGAKTVTHPPRRPMLTKESA